MHMVFFFEINDDMAKELHLCGRLPWAVPPGVLGGALPCWRSFCGKIGGDFSLNVILEFNQTSEKPKVLGYFLSSVELFPFDLLFCEMLTAILFIIRVLLRAFPTTLNEAMGRSFFHV